MPMSDCFIGYRLRQRLNEMEGRLEGSKGLVIQPKDKRIIVDTEGWSKKDDPNIKKCLTSPEASTKSVGIGGDVAGVQPTVKDDQGDLK